MTQKKRMTHTEGWALAIKLAAEDILQCIEKVADAIGCAASTVYRWKDGGDKVIDGYIAANLKELAVKKGIIKA